MNVVRDARVYRVAAIEGDGIGKETTPVGVAVIDAVAKKHDFTVDWHHFDWGSDRYHTTGAMMPDDGVEQLKAFDAIFFGAVGDPAIPDTVTLWGLLIPLRRGLNLSVNVRPARTFDGVPGPLRSDLPVDLVIVRENVEGEYSSVGGRAFEGTPREMAVQEAIFTREGVSRAAEYACRLASRRSGRLTSATKSNGIVHTMPFWDEVVADVAAAHQGVQLTSVLVDALAAALVGRPHDFDVIVASNLLGDILSDLTAALVGSIGLAASANIDPDSGGVGLFEPVHGSAPDIAGRGLANPIAQVLAGSMLLDHLGEHDAAADVEAAVRHVLAAGPRTRDIGGQGSTSDVAEALLEHIGRSAAHAGEAAHD
ncbi:MAG TPA: isocitrate/isopropylmalate family dehydrogenase [Microbacterium sp.]|uniref:isocitrate/isopropylmalate dehydrogenase family protein n=1 Tax=Microbacterium sp. TaxID=51671 RepID=UPI002B49B2C2|nr:isocitrate/isopropylmalate family dehydrogenase [Microbacterium sp.]HKT58167.1 isocitrate/isopropylmalate family dehydrogenase [Microbacterium sp.]